LTREEIGEEVMFATDLAKAFTNITFSFLLSRKVECHFVIDFVDRF